MSINVKIALGVGRKFAIVDSSDVRHINLKNTGTIVYVDGDPYVLVKGNTFADSQKVDDFFDSNGVTELDIDKHLSQNGTWYDVTVVQTGSIRVCANSHSEAIAKVNGMKDPTIKWSGDWEATDATEEI